jgi:hypothetical protein
MKDILYVLGLKKNLLSISALDKKGYRVAFIDGEVLMWAKGETLNEAIVIGSEENGLYNLKGHTETARKKERKKESIFNLHEAKNSLLDRLFFHLAFVFGPFPVKFYNNRSQLLNKLFAE